MTANLVRLPTAARRQVQQPTGRAARDYRAAFREAHPWLGEYLSPDHRDAQRRRSETQSLLADLGQSPEFAIILALLRTMPADRIEAIGLSLDLFPGTADSTALRQARAVVDLAAESRRAMDRIAHLYGDQI